MRAYLAEIGPNSSPGEVLTDLPALDSDGLTVRPAGRRMLKGFAEPVAVWSVDRTRRADGAEG